MKTEPGYEPLASTLNEALDQAQYGKGAICHADGLPFMQQPIMAGGRECGPGGLAFQARKKILEALNCEDDDRAIADLLGAINYTAAMVLLREESNLRRTAPGTAYCVAAPAGEVWQHSDARGSEEVQCDEKKDSNACAAPATPDPHMAFWKAYYKTPRHCEEQAWWYTIIVRDADHLYDDAPRIIHEDVDGILHPLVLNRVLEATSDALALLRQKRSCVPSEDAHIKIFRDKYVITVLGAQASLSQ